MKKIVSLVLLVAMMMTSMVAIAESDITLPAGLEFGMSIDKAVAISGFEKSEGSYWWGAQIEEMGFSEKAYISGTATIGGYEAQVHCFFDDEGLKQVEYKITVNPDDETTAKAECDKIKASLSSKYGEPVERDKAQHQYSPAGIVSYKDNFYDYQRIGFDKNATWIVSMEDGGSIYIDQYHINEFLEMKNGSMGFSYPLYITYTYYDFQIDTTTETNTSVDF